MARGELILRQWNLLRALQTRGIGLPLQELADECGVSERTIQRDFEALQEIGFPIEHEEDDYGKRFWRLPHDFFKTGPLVMGLTEAVSLYLAERLFAPLAGTLFAEGLASMLQKIRSSVPRKALEYFQDLDDTLYVRRLGQTDYTDHDDTIRTLTEAALKETSVETSYRALWRRQEYTTLFDPYGLVFYEGDLFAVGRSHRAGAVRIFKVARIGSVSPTTQAFQRPTDFSLDDQFRSTFGIVQAGAEPVEVVARFTGAAAALVEEREWHESQTLAWLDPDATLFDESPDLPETLMATFQLANLVEFKRWIKGFGDQAEVIKPAWLRQALRDELLAAARCHDG